jgi:hypothetical protein
VLAPSLAPDAAHGSGLNVTRESIRSSLNREAQVVAGSSAAAGDVKAQSQSSTANVIRLTENDEIVLNGDANTVTTRTGAVAGTQDGAGLVLAAVLASGCASLTPVPPDQPVAPLSGPAPVRGTTQVDEALRCLAEHFPRDVDLRLSVNDLTDGTGATLSGDPLSRALTSSSPRPLAARHRNRYPRRDRASLTRGNSPWH